MATTTYHEYDGDGSNKDFNYTFPTYVATEVKVLVDQVLVDNWTIVSYSTSGTNIVRFDNTTGTTNTDVCASDGSPKAGTANVRVYRDTGVDTAKATYAAGSSVKAGDLNNNQTQLLRALQEEQNKSITSYDLRNDSVTSSKIKDGSIVNADINAAAEIAVSKLADGSARQVLQTAANGSDVEWTNNLDLPGTLDVTGATDLDGTLNVDGTATLATVDINAGNIDNTVIGAGTAVAGTFTTGTIATADINSGAIDGTTIGASSAAAGTFTTGTIATADINGGNIDGTTIGASSPAAGTFTNGTITTADINGGAIDGTIIGANTAAAGTFTNGTIATADINGGAIDGTVIGANSTAAGSFTTINASGNITGNLVGNVTGAVTGGITGNAGTATDLADAAKITAAEQASHTVNDTTYFTTSAAEARYFNASTSETIKDGDTFPDNDTTIATTAAINDRIVDIVDGIGGFVPLVDEGEIPQYHPEKENALTSDRVGTILSIGILTTTYAPSGGTCTIQASDLTNHSVNATITDCGSTELTSGYGVLIETKAQTDAQYAAGPSFKFHRLVPKATEVTTVAGKSTEIGRLGTAAAVEDMGILGTTDCVADMAILGTTDVVADLNTLATSDIVSDMNTLAVSGVISDMDTCATNVANINTVGGAITNVNAVATNITGVHHYADVYQVATSAPTARADNDALEAGDMWFDSSSNKELKVHNGTAYQLVTPAQSVLDDIAIVSGNITFSEDLGLITDAISTGTGNSIETCADNIAKIQALGASAVVADMALLATTDCIADMAILGTSDIVADLAILATTDVVADMAILATTDVVADLNTLGTADVVSDLNTLGTADVVSDMNTLATSANVTAMDNCSGSISNINTTAGSIGNVNTTAGSITNVNTTAGSISNVNTTAGSISNVNTVAGSIADVNRYANEYKIASSTPGSPSAGDLWYNSSGNTLNFYNGSSWTGISPGIAGLVNDSSPQLAGALNADSNNITNGGTFTATSFVGALTGNVTGNCSGTATNLTGSPNVTLGTIDGTAGSNLQLDFGSIA